MKASAARDDARNLPQLFCSFVLVFELCYQSLTKISRTAEVCTHPLFVFWRSAFNGFKSFNSCCCVLVLSHFSFKSIKTNQQNRFPDYASATDTTFTPAALDSLDVNQTIYCNAQTSACNEPVECGSACAVVCDGQRACDGLSITCDSNEECHVYCYGRRVWQLCFFIFVLLLLLM